MSGTSTAWKTRQIRELFEIRQGLALGAHRRTGTPNVPFLRTSNVYWDRIELTELDQMTASNDEITKFDLCAGDVLVCEGGDIGRTAIVRHDLPGVVFQNHLHRLRVIDPAIDPSFFVCWMDFAWNIAKKFQGTGNKTTIPNLSQSRLGAVDVPLPPIAAQVDVATVLRSVRLACDSCVGSIACGEELLGAARHALWSSLSNTESHLLGKIASLSTGTTPSTDRAEYWVGDVPFVKTTVIADCRVSSVGAFVSPLAIDDYSMSVYPPGTVLLAMYGQGKTRGRVALLDVAACTSQNAAAIVCGEKLLPDYLWHDLRRRYQELRQDGIHGQLSHLNLAFVRRLEMTIPPLDEQRRIVEILSAIDSRIDAERRRLAALEDLYRTLLHGLMTGALRVDDPAVARETAQLSLPATPVE